jgi:hypothetical protein
VLSGVQVTVAIRLVLDRGLVVEGAMRAGVVEPLVPVEDGELEIVDTPPGFIVVRGPTSGVRASNHSPWELIGSTDVGGCGSSLASLEGSTRDWGATTGTVACWPPRARS